MTVRLIALLACGACFAAYGDDDLAPRTRVRLAGVSVGAGYTRYSGFPYWYGYGPYYPYFYSPFLYGYGYVPGHGYARGPALGEVKLHAAPRRAEVFLNGAYAGTAKALKTMWLEPGKYHLEIRADGRTTFSRNIYVLSGKSIKIEGAAMEQRP